MIEENLKTLIEICGLNIVDFDPVKANKLYLQADKMRGKENWKKADTLIRQAIECNPYELRYWTLFGLCLNNLSREDENLFEQSQAVFDYTMGSIDFEGMGRFVEDLQTFESLEKKSADDLQEGRWVQAEKGFKELLEMKDNRHEAFRNILDANLDVPKDFMYWNAIAISVKNQGRIDEAEKAFRKSIELNPKEVNTWYFLAEMLADNGRFEEAEAMYREALKLDSKNSGICCDLGSCIANQGRVAEAEEPFRKAVKFDPSNKSAKELLQRCLDFLGKEE
jgi:Flp pilus assembly protein TadD